MSEQKGQARFIEPMLLQRVPMLVQGGPWIDELKLDGYRAEAIKTEGRVRLRSRNNKEFNGRYPTIAQGLVSMPDETVIDGEIVAVDASGRPSFNSLQNYGTGQVKLLYYVFDVMILASTDVMNQPLLARRELLKKQVLAKLDEPVRESPQFEASLPDLIHSVKSQGLARRLGSEATR